MADFRTDTSAIKVDPAKGMSLADMLNIQKSSYELSKMKELYPAMISEQQARSRSAQVGADVAEQTAPFEIQSKKQATESGGMDLATKKQTAIANGYVSKIFDPLIVNAAKNPNSVDRKKLVEDIRKWGMQQGEEAGVDQATSLKLIQPYIDVAENNPGQLQDYLKQRHILGLTPQSRTGALTPSGIQVNTGAGGGTVNTNPFAGMQSGQAIPGTTFTQQLPPTTPIQAPSGEMTYLGATPPNTPIVSQQGPMFQQMAKSATEDYARTQDEAKDVQIRKATFQKIKQLSTEAFTSVGGAKKELLSGIAQAVGIPAYELEKTATDELAKNSAILQLAGGNTDAARQIAEIANPNKKLTKDAITNVSNQLIGIENLKEAKNNYLSPYAKNPEEYTKRLNDWNKVSDYRIFQDMTPAEVAKIKSGMSAAEQKEMSEKIALARKLGIIK
jgi:hypothetical protein